MSRKSSIHFQPVSNVRFAVSHSERTDLSEPAYLLPKEHQLDNVVVAGSLSENELAALFIQQKEGMSRQAKTAGASPFWEGVVVLPNTDGKEQSANLKGWKKEYEQATGHKVLHMAVHLDEGYLDKDGKPQYNPHAHVIVSRMDSKNRVINLDRKQLAKVQDLTAETLKMERGSTLAERQGKRGRAHVPHREFRAQADEKRLELSGPKADLTRLQKLSKQWSDADLAKVKDLQAQLDGEPERQAAALAAQKIQLDEQYRQDRAALKASGEAKQADYQALKKTHEAALAALSQATQKVEKMDEYTKTLNAELAQKDAQIASELVAKAQIIEALVEAGEKSSALLVTSEGHKEAAAKLLVRHEAFKVKANDKIKEIIDEANGKLGALSAENTQLAKDLADAKRFAAMGNNYQAEVANGTPAHLIVPGTPAPMPPKPTKTAIEAPKDLGHPAAPPQPEKSLVDRLKASWEAMLDWVKGKGGKVVQVQDGLAYFGPVVQLDDLHAVQHTGRGAHVIHELAKLDRVPALDDPKMEIQYRDGVGQVKGQGLGRGGRAD